MTASTLARRPGTSHRLRALLTTRGLLALGGLLLFFVPPAFITNQYLLDVLAQVALFVLLGCGLNVVIALAGLLDLGYVAFWGVGAYTAAMLASPHYGLHLPFIAIIPIAMGVCAMFAMMIGLPTLRLRGDYLAIVTLGFGEIVRIFLNNATDITGGATGIQNIDPASVAGYSLNTDLQIFYYVVATACLLVILAGEQLRRSGVGITWQALRDDELAARAAGLWPLMFYLLAFGIGAISGGLSGALFAYLQTAVSPDSFTVDQSFNIVAIVVFAGLTGRFLLIIPAAFIVVGLPEFLRPLAELRLVVFGPLLVLAAFLSYHGPTISKRINARLGWGRRVPVVEAASVFDPEPSPESPPVPSEKPLVGPGESIGAHVHTPSLAADAGSPARGSLVIEGLSKRFGGVQAIKDLALTAEPGYVVGLIGPNGAGKSTVFNLITGVTRPDSGTATFGGQSLVGARPDEIAAIGVRRTFQNIRLFSKLTVEDNVAVGCLRQCGYRIHKARVKSAPLLEQLGLASVRTALPGDLPYAHQRRVEIARALAADPGVLLLDEPAAGMDTRERRDLVALLRTISRDRVVMLVEHDTALVAEACARVYVLDLGQLIFSGDPAGARNDPRVVEAYLGVA